VTSFKNLSIKAKLLIMAGAPLVLALFFIANRLIEVQADAANMSVAHELSEVAVAGNQLVHEIQKERGSSAVYLGSQGSRFKNEVRLQRQQTDKSVSHFLAVYKRVRGDIENAKIKRLLSDIAQQLGGLPKLRQGIDSLNIPLAQAIGTLTQANTNLLNINTMLAAEVNDSATSRLAISYVYFLNAKERAGIERAVVSSILAGNQASAKQKERSITLAVEQNRYMQLFEEMAIPATLAMAKQEMDSGIENKVANVRQTVWTNNTNFGIEAQAWFALASQRINGLKAAESRIERNFQQVLSDKKGQANSSFTLLLIMSFLAAGATAALCIYSSQLINKQLNSISIAMRGLGQNSDLSVQATAYAKDDLGQLALSFNQMVSHIRGLINNMKNADNSLNTTLKSLQDVSNNVNSQVNSGLEQTQMAAVAMNEMGSTVQEVAQNCSSAAARSEQANKSAQAGSQLLQSVREEMKSLSSELSGSHEVIHQLAEDSSEIGSILDVIRGVAEQTNLLALNAAIEAARAGEQGRGFAVVADEVRSLASKTQESTGQIQENIEKLQVGSRKAVNAITQSLELASTTDTSLNNTIDSIGEIIDQISDVNNMNIQIATATEEQSSTVEEINRNVQVIKQQYDDTSGSVSELHQATEEVSQLSQQLSGNVKQFIL